MPNWGDILNEVQKSGHTTDIIRRKYLKKLHSVTKRNIIIYYSGWLQKKQPPGVTLDFEINDRDKNGFMSVIHRLDRGLGLDLILHTPGGDLAATESIIDYLRQMFSDNIRAIVPQMAMSGGALMACACKEIVMGLHSNIGPFDPQINGTAAQAIKAEFDRAGAEMKADPTRAYVWQPILQKYALGFITQVEHAINLADQLGMKALQEGMFKGDPDAQQKAENVIKEIGSNSATKTHSRHIHRARAREIGLNIADLEADERLQDAVLSVHHACMITFDQAGAYKMIENHQGSSYISAAQMMLAVKQS